MHRQDSTIQFSVIMPIYNGDNAAHVSEAIQSLYDQTLRAHEIVIIQDGPIYEELHEVLKSWMVKMPEIKHVVLKVNQGLSGALNAGIDAASHEWLARMDADDICLPHRFEKQVDYIMTHPEISILGSWIVEYDENMEEEIATRKLPETHSELMKYAQWRCPFNHMTVMYKKSALLDLGKYKNYGAVGDDYELWARFLMNGYKAANIQENLVNARTGKDFFGNRRRGWKYFKNELREINDLYRLKLINPLQYSFHFITKFIVRMSPPFLVKIIYRGIRKTS